MEQLNKLKIALAPQLPVSIADAIAVISRHLAHLHAELQHGALKALPQAYWLAGGVDIWNSLCRGLQHAEADGPGRLERLASDATLAACSRVLARIDALLSSPATPADSEPWSGAHEGAARRRAARLSNDVSLPHPTLFACSTISRPARLCAAPSVKLTILTLYLIARADRSTCVDHPE